MRLKNQEKIKKMKKAPLFFNGVVLSSKFDVAAIEKKALVVQTKSRHSLWVVLPKPTN